MHEVESDHPEELKQRAIFGLAAYHNSEATTKTRNFISKEPPKGKTLSIQTLMEEFKTVVPEKTDFEQ